MSQEPSIASTQARAILLERYVTGELSSRGLAVFRPDFAIVLRPDLFISPAFAADVFCDQSAIDNVLETLHLKLHILTAGDGLIVPCVTLISNQEVRH